MERTVEHLCFSQLLELVYSLGILLWILPWTHDACPSTSKKNRSKTPSTPFSHCQVSSEQSFHLCGRRCCP
ncbi:hypothetical protein G7K_0261-t1 [Saitoella complicata NRRL Y-17804]|uniref:Uncharacterized protein n=1 Tax=Saitoella complicata (strain BCRC 22490 / CBS 7301 / JCM 7358 / NBRC 10748 / NRRL Y-17804) TaxID=698492 RepID=A0A0E9N8J1_SAICN|nr:hypothetical protein G7K_0261-t1 [Saitoella complicata NRRL Y-17804]